MRFGLYQFKSPFRKFITFLLPFFKDSDPNTISWSLLPIGLIICAIYYHAPENSWLYLLGILMIFVRMIVATLDGYVAETFHKQSRNGDILNRLVPEICDILLLISVIAANPNFALGLCLMGIAWLSSFFGLIGLVGEKPALSMGPLGQTDRLALLMLCSLLEYLAKIFSWDFSFILLFLNCCVLAGLLTIANRFRHLLYDEPSRKFKSLE